MTRLVRADAPVLGRFASPAVALSVSVRVSAGSDSAARRSVPVPVGVARPPARALASIDGEAPTSSGPRPPGSNRPVRMDRNTALTSTPSPSVGVLDALVGVLSAGPERLALGGRLDLGLGSGPVAEPPQLGDDQVQALTLDELHGVKADIPILAHLVDRHDVGVVQSRRGAGLAAEPLLDHPVAGHLPRQDLERHPAAQRDLLGLVHHAHAAPADLAEDPVVADLAQGWIRGPGILGLLLALPHTLGLLDLDHRREQLADLIGQLRVAVGVFLERGAFAAAEASREFLGQLIEQVILFRFRDRHRSDPSRPPGIAARIDLSFLSARM